MAAKKAPTPKKAVAPRKEASAAQEQSPLHDNVDLLDDLPLMVSIELGRCRKPLEDVTTLGEQSLIELDKQVGDPVDIMLNSKLFARGEVVTVSENFGVRITEIIGQA